MKIIETITAESFAPYGKVLQFSGEKPDTCFEIIVTEEKSPWRLAMFRVKNTECLRLECHPTSLESFEPYRYSTGSGTRNPARLPCIFTRLPGMFT